MNLTTKWIMRALKAIQEGTCIYAVNQRYYMGGIRGKIEGIAYSFDKMVFRIIQDDSQNAAKVYSFLALHGADRIEWDQVEKLLRPSEPDLAVKLDKLPSIRRDNKSYILFSEFIFSKSDLAQLTNKDSAIIVKVNDNYGYMIVYDEFKNIIGICCGQNRRIRT